MPLQAGLDLEAVADSEDPFGGEDDCHDEVAALAKKFEEKYVSNYVRNLHQKLTQYYTACESLLPFFAAAFSKHFYLVQ